jgi:hypothetical protein
VLFPFFLKLKGFIFDKISERDVKAELQLQQGKVVLDAYVWLCSSGWLFQSQLNKQLF